MSGAGEEWHRRLTALYESSPRKTQSWKEIVMSKVTARGKNEISKKKAVKKTSTTNKPKVEPKGRTVSNSRARVESESTSQQVVGDAAGEQPNLATLMREKSTLSSNALSYDAMMQVANLFKDVHKKMEESLDKIEKREMRLLLTETAFNNLRLIRGASELIWKIDEFSGKFKDAENGSNPILYSRAFKAHGYETAVGLCPYGEGGEKGRYMSIFFVILRGKNDVTLEWPFNYSVTFTLLGQSDTKQTDDIAVTFTPNPIASNAAFLGMPTSERNQMLGMPQFVAHTDLWKGNFVKDDTIFIRVRVHH